MTELMVSRQQTFPMEYPLLAELSGSLSLGGYDPGYTRYTRGMAELAGDRDTFHGMKVTNPAAAERRPRRRRHRGRCDVPGRIVHRHEPGDPEPAVLGAGDLAVARARS